MKKGFTLVELLIVVVVLVTLMSITFRLSSITSNQSERAQTVARLQKLENCLSGYYAAYGSYPPVRLHGSRNYTLGVSGHGIQNGEGSEGTFDWSFFDADSRSVRDSDLEKEAWEKVQAACKAQPVACKYPYPSDSAWETLAEAASKIVQRKAAEANLPEDDPRHHGFTLQVSGSLSSYQERTQWSGENSVQAFQFGLMSFLLPRFVVMMGGCDSDEFFEDQAQWVQGNTLPCDPMTGKRFPNWKEVRDCALSDDPKELARITSIPSQAVCARWMPNLEGICQFNQQYSIFGIDIRDEYDSAAGVPTDLSIEIYSPGNQDGTSGQYVLDGVTVLDGWNEPFYYYSPAPYQSYVLWSSGANKRTFPPWVSRKEISGDAAVCIGYWTEDDIVSMSN